jgi:hypothetical protein
MEGPDEQEGQPQVFEKVDNLIQPEGEKRQRFDVGKGGEVKDQPRV